MERFRYLPDALNCPAEQGFTVNVKEVHDFLREINAESAKYRTMLFTKIID